MTRRELHNIYIALGTIEEAVSRHYDEQFMVSDPNRTKNEARNIPGALYHLEQIRSRIIMARSHLQSLMGELPSSSESSGNNQRD